MGINDVCTQILKIIKVCNPVSLFMLADEQTLISPRSLFDTDEFLQGQLPTYLSYQHHIWRWIDKVYFPKSRRQFILEQVHNKPTAGHWVSVKTCDLLTRTCDWPGFLGSSPGPQNNTCVAQEPVFFFFQILNKDFFLLVHNSNTQQQTTI